MIVRYPNPIVSAEIRDQESRTKLMEAASRGQQTLIATLLERTSAIFYIDWKDEENRTALSRAAQNGHEGFVKLLLARDEADSNSQDEQGCTPLHCGHTTVLNTPSAQRHFG